MTDTTATSVEDLDLPVVDVLSPGYEADPLGLLAAAREQGDGMARSRRGVELLSYAWVSALLNDQRFHTVDARHFEQQGGPQSLLDWARDGLLLSMEKERHDKVRRVLVRAFTLRRVDEHRDLMQEVAGRWADHLVASEHHDVVDDFTLHYPMEVLCRVLGVPTEEIPRFIDAALDLHLLAAVPMAPGFDRIDAALRTLEDYVVDIVARRASEPQDDFLSGLVEAQAIEGDLTQGELVGNVINLLFAGAGTTRMQLASAVRLVVEHGLWDDLANEPERIPDVIEECMRYAPVTQFVVRIPHDDVVIDGLRFPAKRRVILNLLAASRDPAVFGDPDRFDPTRPDLGRSKLPFGWGAHYCIGHALARAVMREALVVLTRRFTGVAVAEPPELAPAAAMLGGPEHLHLRLAPRPASPPNS